MRATVRSGTRRATLSTTTVTAILIYGAAFTASWTAVAVNGFNVVDYFLAAAALATIGAWLGKRRPIYISPWMVGPFAAMVLSTSIDVITTGGGFSGTDLFRVLLSTAVIAVILTSEASVAGVPTLIRGLRWWAAGIAVNAAASIGVSWGIISLEALRQPNGDRLSGLSSHPNSVAFSITLGLPALIYFAFVARDRLATRVSWILAVVVSVWGLYLSDSRAGWIVAIPTLAVAMALALRQSRMRSLTIPLLIVGAILAVAYVPGLLADTRLAEGSEQSDTGRTGYNNDALSVFLANPLTGGGFDDQTGVSVPLMVLSGGGILLAVTYYLFILWPVPTLWRARRDGIAHVGLLSVLVLLGFGLLNPVFLERAAFWPILIPALVLLVRSGDSTSSPWSKDRDLGRGVAARLPVRR